MPRRIVLDNTTIGGVTWPRRVACATIVRDRVGLSPETALTQTDLDDLFGRDAIADPYPLLAQLREQESVHWNAAYQLWVVTSYADVVTLVRDPDAFSSAVIKNDDRAPYPPIDPDD